MSAGMIPLHSREPAAPVLLASEPVLLAIETAGSACSAAVARGERVLAAECRALRHGHAEALFPMIERVMQKAGLAPSQLDAVAMALGPGGFTGIRVGLAAAHGIALAVGARLVGVTSFAAVAARMAGRRVAEQGDSAGQTLLVALDSRRADLYAQLFALDAASPLAAPQALLADRLADYVAGGTSSVPSGLPGDAPLLIAGDAAEVAAAALRGHAAIAVAGNSAPDAEGVLAAALRQLRYDAPAGAPVGALPGPVRPLYLRAPNVTLPNLTSAKRSLAQRLHPIPAAAR
jgi:tRNA threonylcarbamoyladenosine biosynthesis protein TsaB